MKKALLMLVAVLALCLVGCNEEQAGKMTLWGTFEKDATGARIGYAEGPIEGGVYGAWRPASEDPPNIFGVYSLYSFGPVDVNNPIPIEWLPEKFSATPYFGGYVTVDFQGDDTRALGGPMAGIKLLDVLALEYRYQFVNGPLEASYDNGQSIFALCIPIPLR